MRSSPEAVIQAFAAVARPVILRYFVRRSCIASSRIAIECLRKFGVGSRPQPVRFTLHAPDINAMYVAGVLPEDATSLKRKAEKYVSLPPDSGNGWPAHLVVMSGNVFIDPSFDQALAAMADQGENIWHEPLIFVVPLPDAVPIDFTFEARGILNDGTTVDIRYDALDDSSYADQPAWETDHLQPAIAEIEALMSVRLARSSVEGEAA